MVDRQELCARAVPVSGIRGSVDREWVTCADFVENAKNHKSRL